MTKRWVVSGSLHTCFIAMDFFLANAEMVEKEEDK